MSSSTADGGTAAVLTISDSCSRGEKTDSSGPALVEALRVQNFRTVVTGIVSDDQQEIEKAIIRMAKHARLVVTTGGTGLGPRDVTPEATRAVCERIIEGIAERMRMEGAKRTPFAALSRGVCGVRGWSVVLNLPGSPKGAIESLDAVVGLLPHILDLLEGHTEHM